MKEGCPDNNSGGGGNNSGNNGGSTGGGNNSSGNGNARTSTNNDKTTPNPDRSTTTPPEATKTSVFTVTTTDSNGQAVTTVASTTIIAGGGPLQTGIDGGNGLAGGGEAGIGGSNDGGSKKLSSGAIAGIVVGALLGIALLALLIFLFLRRRKKAKESYNYTPAQADYPPPMANVPGIDSDKGAGMPETPASTVLQTPQEGYNGVFAPFGGKIVSTPTTNVTTPGIGNGDARDSRISYVSSMASDTLAGSPSPFSRHTLSVEGFPTVPQLDSSPVFVQEMDATPSPRPISELPANPPSSATTGGAALQGLGVQSGAANVARPQSTPLEPVAEDSSPPRATFTATDEERSRRMYVTSWSRFEGSPDITR